jgi:hypothetical protein
VALRTYAGREPKCMHDFRLVGSVWVRDEARDEVEPLVIVGDEASLDRVG